MNCYVVIGISVQSRVVDRGHFFNQSVGRSVCAPRTDGSVGPFGPTYVYSLL
jgi:hypothetical protein